MKGLTTRSAACCHISDLEGRRECLKGLLSSVMLGKKMFVNAFTVRPVTNISFRRKWGSTKHQGWCAFHHSGHKLCPEDCERQETGQREKTVVNDEVFEPIRTILGIVTGAF